MWLGPVAPTCTLNRVLDSVIHRCVFAITKVVLLVGRACQRTDPRGQCIGTGRSYYARSIETVNCTAAEAHSRFVKMKPVSSPVSST